MATCYGPVTSFLQLYEIELHPLTRICWAQKRNRVCVKSFFFFFFFSFFLQESNNVLDIEIDSFIFKCVRLYFTVM
jgi:hypothetical protein